MKLLITIFQDEDGAYIAECPSIPGCLSQGSTEQEAKKNIQEAIKECLEVRAEKRMPRLEFQHLLASRRISLHYDIADFKNDLETLKRLDH